LKKWLRIVPKEPLDVNLKKKSTNIESFEMQAQQKLLL